jgi:hypothetical protein
MQPELDTNWTFDVVRMSYAVSPSYSGKGAQQVKQPPKSQEYKHCATSILTTNSAESDI